MTERQALVGAGLAHILLFAALSLGWSMLKTPPVVEEAIPVELVDVAPETRVTEKPQPSRAAAPQETAAPAPQPEVARPEPTPIPDPEPLPEPKPVVKPTPPKPQPKPDPKPVEQPKPKPTKVVKAEPKPQRLDTAELSDLIDKQLPKAPKKVRDPSDFANSIAMSIPKSAKLDARATASLAAAIRAQILRCWNRPIGGDTSKMTVVLSIQLARDGSVLGRPSVIDHTGVTAANAGYAKAFGDSAVRAVFTCSPFKLPPEMYDGWKAFELNFDPSDG